MTESQFTQLREKEHAILCCIRDGQNDTRQIREGTTLSNREVNYCLDKLEDRGLIDTETPDGRVTTMVDGRKRTFKAPREAALTDRGQAYLAWADRERTKYQDMTHDELVERMQELEQRIDDIEAAFEAFRQQVLDKLE